MRILHVIPCFTPRRGGSVSVVQYLTRELSRRGHSVTIATSDFEFDEIFSGELERDGVKVIPFQCRMNIGMMLFTPDMKKWLASHFKEFDLVHVHNFRSYQSNIVRQISGKVGIPYLLQAHGSIPRIGERTTLKRLYDLAWGRHVLEDACLYVAVAETEVRQYERAGVEVDKILVIPNGLDISGFKKLPKKGTFLEKHAIGNHRIVMYLGRVDKAKRIDLLVRSFKIVAERLQDVVLIIAGPDEGYRVDLEKHVQSLGLETRVVFINFIDNAGDGLQDADVVVNPRAEEIFGLVPFEAILCGTPVIVSHMSGSGEMIAKAQCGYVIDTEDEWALAEAIIRILEEPFTSEILVSRGKEFIAKNLDWRQITQRYEETYARCIHEAQARRSV
jgi:glycosyltransferase involved in cell wall biosynthesis